MVVSFRPGLKIKTNHPLNYFSKKEKNFKSNTKNMKAVTLHYSKNENSDWYIKKSFTNKMVGVDIVLC